MPVFIPRSHFSGKLAVATYLNPMAPIIESFREVMLGVGSVEPVMIVVSLVGNGVRSACGHDAFPTSGANRGRYDLK